MSVAVPVLLALDTATDRVHAALAVGTAVQTLDLPGGAQASAQLLPALQGLLRDAGLTWSDLDAIAFGSGPGAFTGLRTACSVTQGLALGADCPVIVLDTLMAVAEDARQQAPQGCVPGDVVWVLQDARMEELYVGAFTWDGADWQVAQAAQLWPLTEPVARWTQGSPNTVPGLRLCGNALQAYPERFAPLCRRAPQCWARRRPRHVPAPWPRWRSEPGRAVRRWTWPWPCRVMCATRWRKPPPSAGPSLRRRVILTA